MLSRTAILLVLACALAGASAPRGSAADPLRRPPVHWLQGEGNFTKAHRGPLAIRRIVIHVTEGSFWGSVRWLRNERAHASSHYVVSRNGRIVQLVHLSDIAWHAGNWGMNVQSVGIEHEGYTYDPAGFTQAQYRASARLTAYLARRSLIPIDRVHVIGHGQVPGPRGGLGGASHHTDPGPYWNWREYLRLVRRFASGQATLRVVPQVAAGSLRGVVPWRAATAGGVRRVEFYVDGRLRWEDRRAPFAFAGGRGLNTTSLSNGAHTLELRAYGAGTRHDVARARIVVRNRAFDLTTAGARHWGRVRGVVSLRARVWGAKAAAVGVRVDGDRLAVDRRPPFRFRWNSRRRHDGKHVITLLARSVDGREARRRLVVVVANRPAPKRPRVQAPPVPAVPPVPTLRVTGGSPAAGATVAGFVLWRADVAGRPARVEFWLDGVLRGSDVARPYTLGWDAAAETPGAHRLLVKAIPPRGRIVERATTVTVAEPT
jgi:hypothetical protein